MSSTGQDERESLKQRETPVCLECVPCFKGAQQNSRSKYDFVIIGAGLAGCWSAYWIRKTTPNAKLLLIDSRGSQKGSLQRQEDGEVGDKGPVEDWSTPSAVNAGSLSSFYDGNAVLSASYLRYLVRSGYPDITVCFPTSLYEAAWLTSLARHVLFPSRSTKLLRTGFFRDLETHSIELYKEVEQEMKEKGLSFYNANGRYVISNKSKGSKQSYFSPPPIASPTLEEPPVHAYEDEDIRKTAPWLGLSTAYLYHYPTDYFMDASLFLSSMHKFLARDLGVDILYGTKVEKVLRDGKLITGVQVADSQSIKKEPDQLTVPPSDHSDHTARRVYSATSSYVFCTGTENHPVMNTWTMAAYGISLKYKLKSAERPHLQESIEKHGDSAQLDKGDSNRVDRVLAITSIGPTLLNISPLESVIQVTSGCMIGKELDDSKKELVANAIESRLKMGLSYSALRGIDFESRRIQTGGRPICPDGLPVVGRHPDYMNAWILNGLGHYGHVAAMLGRLLRDQMFGSKKKREMELVYGIDPADLSPGRFWMRGWSAKASFPILPEDN